MSDDTQGPPGRADWPLVKALFDAASVLPAAEREAHLQAAAVSAAVRDEVRSLLAHLDDTAWLQAPAATAAPPAVQAGDRFGAWEIQRPLGSGGMGEVFEARRADGQFEGRAAIKLLKRGLDSRAVLDRFALERSALARLSHPHIARLFDAGQSAAGLPYFVMELVDGRPIDAVALELPLEARLGLFLQLTDAVSHAHHQLLVHRDLKPGNVLVTADGQVKLLDFGIAKALDPLEGGELPPDITQAQARPFTPHYASPEQVRGEAVSTATDIYSLGVLLYVMLTGARPYGRSATTPHEAARSVLEEEPSPPSSLAPDLVSDPQWLATRKRLRGDLDNILLKALDKRIERRYPSVETLSADVRAFLAGFPVSAQAPSVGYRVRKFALRHRWSVAAATVALLALLGGSALALWQARVADQQRVLAERRFDEVRQFARTMLFDVDTALRDGPTAGREKLVATALQYLDRLSAERSTDQALLRDLAEAYERVGDIQGNTAQANLGRPDDAKKSFDKALALRRSLAQLAPDDLKNILGLLNVHERFGDQRRSASDLQGAAAHYGEAVRHATRLAQAQPDQLLPQLRRVEAERYLASAYYWPFNPSLNDYARARPMIEALDRRMEALLAAHPASSDVKENYGSLLNQLSDFQRIAGEYPAALDTQRKSHRLASELLAESPDNPRRQRWLYLAEGRLADALLETGDTDAGIVLWQRSIERREQGARADAGNERAQRNLANGYGPLAEQLDILGRHAEALAWYQRENRLLRLLHERHPQVKALVPRLDDSDRDLAVQLALNGKTAEGLALWRALQARQGFTADPRDADEAKTALAHLRLLSTLPAAAELAIERERAEAQGRAAVTLLDKAAAAEPFNTLLVREAAWGAGILATALKRSAPAEACTISRRAAQQLDALATAGRLAATWKPQHEQLRRQSLC